MKSREIASNGERTFMVVFESGEDIADGLRAFAGAQGLTAARISGVGGLSRATLGYFEWGSKSYLDIPVSEQVEVLSFDGDVALAREGPAVHVHVVLGRSDGTTLGGHLMDGTVRPTMEVMVVEAPARLRRIHDEETGLDLIDPGR